MDRQVAQATSLLSYMQLLFKERDGYGIPTKAFEAFLALTEW